MLVHIYNKKYKTKPSGKEIGNIKHALIDHKTIKDLSIEKIAAALTDGKTIEPGVCPFSEKSRQEAKNDKVQYPGTKKQDFKEQTLFMNDIDNTFDDIKPETPEHVAKILNDHNLKAAFMYETFSSGSSSKKSRQRFRFGLVSGEAFTDKAERDRVQLALIKLFPQSDTGCKAADRVFFGTDKGLIEEYTDFNAICDKSDLLALADQFHIPADPEQDAGDSWQYESRSDRMKYGDVIPIGQRHDTLVSFASAVLKKYGIGEDAKEAFKQRAAQCEEPMTDNELKSIWQSACGYYKKSISSDPDYIPPKDYAFLDGFKPEEAAKTKELPLLTSFDEVEEKQAAYIVPTYITAHGITLIAGTGGVGKTSLVCQIISDISAGRPTIFNNAEPYEDHDKTDLKPERVLFFSAEDSVEYVLKRKLRKCKALMKNIFFLDMDNPAFKDLKFDSDLLRQLVAKYRPAICVFDPLQSFIDKRVEMSSRNAMRQSLEPLIALAEKYETAFLIVAHTNKQHNAWGRNRIADSADIWDISRSVLIVGEVGENATDQRRYISHEKSSYCPRGQSIIFGLVDEVPEYLEVTTKRDKDFVFTSNSRRDLGDNKQEVKEEIIGFLNTNGGRASDGELKDYLTLQSFSNRAIKEAKAELRKENAIAYDKNGFGGKWDIVIIDTSQEQTETDQNINDF